MHTTTPATGSFFLWRDCVNLQTWCEIQKSEMRMTSCGISEHFSLIILGIMCQFFTEKIVKNQQGVHYMNSAEG